jgi:L-lysine 2,3-aminomutase
MYQLTFPQPGMLDADALEAVVSLIKQDAPEANVLATARRIQQGLNPHPAGQMELNVPRLGDRPLPGVQHKYRETVLFFPSQGQTCHAYCTYCFRWAQFVGIDELKFANREAE